MQIRVHIENELYEKFSEFASFLEIKWFKRIKLPRELIYKDNI